MITLDKPFRILYKVLFIFSITFIFSSKQSVVNSLISSSSFHHQNSNINPPKISPHSVNGNRDDLILWYEDFENGENGGSFDAGWEITETSSMLKLRQMDLIQLFFG